MADMIDGGRVMECRELEAALGLMKLGWMHKIDVSEQQLRKTRLQTCILNSVFKMSRFPSPKSVFDIALLINVHPKSVQKWFQNARQLSKRRSLATKDTWTQDASAKHGAFDIAIDVLVGIVQTETEKKRCA
ncbi:hypothetical protein HK407_02g04100 [Ordospora pajunii]|jgi:hypothetical protein|uniref:uncharacterized protein n=1 Tax=Ordospora pajunii TaxID=3039483 RepID=UPI0029526944|nr:uncharacterized protein HK407_02g04100 [Ordospora pajunii]KAH9411963.1 hypothetical protein HK407_02g04100 [Ordospora pajunii]